ncbi:hypothetical protein [Marinobacterium rhizophilum]|uniref:Uncharacterized protein n=1 Tax=Marinobacterium rhizophilum TaxID=420402 RepID=A0ABY5HJS3_9GAMM|nr:hypothetical protein [Marinobacterium rhizophilum]UTW11524.1 hypothetical protein KDW95_20075 [Marinobacterium rhizophilum]
MSMIPRYKYCNFITAVSSVLLFLIFALAVPAHGVPFDCASFRCGLQGDGSYPHLVVGTVRRIADETNSKAVYDWARKNEYWALLPDDQARFTQSIQMVSVEIPSQSGVEEITLLMGREDFDAIKIQAGDLVRYRPHESSYGAAKNQPTYSQGTSRPYWDLFGCIAVLCRAEDEKCPQRYSSGIYRLSDGVALNHHGQVVSDAARRIDIITYLPVKSIKD